MAKSVIRTMLVIGDNHEDIAKKYSLDTKVDSYVRYKRDDAEKLQQKHLKILDSILSSNQIKLTTAQREIYRDLYLDIKDMDDFDYYLYISDGCVYDEETGDALSTENPNAHYRGEKCYQNRLETTNEEGYLSTPFTLKDGTKSYVAKKGDIDWDIMHMYNSSVNLYKCAWHLIVDYPEIENADNLNGDELSALEKKHTNDWIIENATKFDIPLDTVNNIWVNMHLRHDYFACFSDCDEYVKHSASFWTYSVATDKKYETVSHKVSDKEWVRKFYDKYIKNLPDDTLLSIYEIRLLED